jgi:hypothetical protein
MSEIRERPQSKQKTSMVGRLGGGAGDAGAPTINTKKRRWRPPWEAVPEIRERPPLPWKTSMASPLGGGARDLEASTINTKKRRWQPPWDAVPEIRKRLPSTEEMLTVGVTHRVSNP